MVRINDTDIVNRITNELNLQPPSVLDEKKLGLIRAYIQESLAMIEPFVPSRDASERLNGYLLSRGATQMQCIVAWTMFADMRQLASLHHVPYTPGYGRG